MPMKRSDIVEKEQEFKKFVETIKKAVLNLLNSDKNYVYESTEIVAIVQKDLYQRGLETEFCDEKVRHAIFNAIFVLAINGEITKNYLDLKDYYGSK